MGYKENFKSNGGWERVRLAVYEILVGLLLVGITAVAFHFGGKLVGIITLASSLVIIAGAVIAWIIWAGKRNKKEIDELRSSRRQGGNDLSG